MDGTDERLTEQVGGIRVDPRFRRRIQTEAARRFGGNEALLMREATRLYLDLRDHLGPRFELVIDSLTRDDESDAA